MRYIDERARGAGRYQSFAEFHTQVVLSGYHQYGWVDEQFYELWPGGRCVNRTKSLTKDSSVQIMDNASKER